MDTIARRITAILAAGLLTAALATTPASALRLVPRTSRATCPLPSRLRTPPC